MKSERQAAILELVRTNNIFTQGELTKALTDAGFSATQATISRDIRELRLTKEPVGTVGLKYAAPETTDLSPLHRVFRDGLLSMDCAGHMLVLRTLSGMAMAVAVAVDAMNFPEILGSIAGDDAVMCVIKTEAQAIALMEKLENLPK